jgi:tRNA (5-methylaminomethyl-2-thiouridylate)-methyltransferase
MKKTVILGMSGGVDSSVAAVLLLEQGYDVHGITLLLKNHIAKINNNPMSDAEDAAKVCKRLGIKHHVMDFSEIFKEKVINYFTGEYICGRTPNPCVKCNQFIKFNALIQKADEVGAQFIATGHYAKTKFDESSGRYFIYKSDSSKDQSYVLYSLSQDTLSRVLFPIEGLAKQETREIAKKYGLSVSSKPDSQEICFISDNNYAGFIKDNTEYTDNPGCFLDENGNKIGKHKGIIYYTIGQRKGLGTTFGKPMYVTKIDAENNTVTLGEEGSQYFSRIEITELKLVSMNELTEPIEAEVKVRYQAKPQKAVIYPVNKDKASIILKEPGRAITPGQAAVFYNGDVVLGGGIIESMSK